MFEEKHLAYIDNLPFMIYNECFAIYLQVIMVYKQTELIICLCMLFMPYDPKLLKDKYKMNSK